MFDPNADLLFSVLALQNKFVSRDQLIEALNLWAIDKKRSLAEMVAERGTIATEDQQLLKRLVERQLEVHGEVEASLCENTGTLDLADHCSQIDDIELREHLQSFSSRMVNSQLTLTRFPGSRQTGALSSGRLESGFESSKLDGTSDQVSRPQRQDSASQISNEEVEFDPNQTGLHQGDATHSEAPHVAQSLTSVRPSNRWNANSSAGKSHSDKSNSAEPELDATAASRPLAKDSRESKRSASDRSQVSASAASSLGSLSASRFSIVNSHAKGGLGEVFLARDHELDREVALKEIQRKFASNEEAQVRFEFEALITGGLEHPGVVPVYAYGKYSDGRPFYAMRFIRGRSMKEEISEYHRKIEAGASENALRLALRGLLRRFVDACQAIGYAHSRGVVHRDLKPANVMLGKFGETLVVDWGLAKSVGRDDYHSTPDEVTLLPLSGASGSGTMHGSTLGTPGYMSPEQAAGKLHEMGPPSDIFSLGATLYSILVGSAPFEGKKASEIVANAAENRFVEPIKKMQRVPRPLNAIVMKAMATRPGDRYRTAMELVTDVEAYLADELISAYQETVWERSQRWVRRHRTLATAAFVLVTTLGLASALGAVLLNSEKNRTQLALDQVSEEQTRTAAALKQVETEEKKKSAALAALTVEQEKTQRALTAETRARRQTREMLNTISDDLVGELMGQQVVMTEANQRFFDRVLQQFEQFTMSMDSSSEAQNLRADGYFRVANLQRRLTRLDEAQGAYTKSIEAWKKLAAEFPNNFNYQQDLAAAQANLGLVFAARSNFPAALEQYTLAAKQFSDLLAIAKTAKSDETNDIQNSKGDADSRSSETNTSTSFVSTAASMLDSSAISKIERELARLNGNLANTLVNLNRRGEAEPYYKRALEGFSKLQSSSLAETASDQARILGNYAAFVSREQGRMPEARKLMEEAVETLSSIGVDGDGKLPPRLRLDLSQYRKNLGKILAALGEKELAIEKSRATVSELSNLADEFPAVSDYRRELAVNQVELANLLRVDQPEQANIEFDSAIKSFERIIADNPTQTRTRRELAASLDNWGTWLAETKFDAAKGYFDRARKNRLELQQAEPDNPTLRDEWFVGENNWANNLRERKDYQTAIPIYKQLLQTLKDAEEPEQDPLYPTKLRLVRFGLADSLSRTDQFEAALPIWSLLVQNQTDEDWAIFEFQRAICLIRTGKIDDGLAAGKALVEVDKPEPVWLYDMACCYAIAQEMSAGSTAEGVAPDEKVEKQQKEWGEAAIKFLNLAGEMGFFDSSEMRNHAATDNDLKSLRGSPDFESFREKYLNQTKENF